MLLKTQNLKKYFGGVKAVDGVDITIDENEKIVGLIGPNGAGKTTFFNLITGMIKPDEGEVRFKEEDIFGCSPDEVFRKGLARTFQTPRIADSLTVIENMLYVPANIYENPLRTTFTPMSKIKEKDKKLEEKASKILEDTMLYEKRKDLARNLNVGERKLLELSRILMVNSDLILADEPTAGLSDEDTKTIMKYIDQISKERTFMIIEHKMGVIKDLSERIIVLHLGKVLTEDIPQKILKNKEVIEIYIGE